MPFTEVSHVVISLSFHPLPMNSAARPAQKTERAQRHNGEDVEFLALQVKTEP